MVIEANTCQMHLFIHVRNNIVHCQFSNIAKGRDGFKWYYRGDWT